MYENLQRIFFKSHIFILFLSSLFFEGQTVMPPLILNENVMRNAAYSSGLCAHMCRHMKHCKPQIWATMETLLSTLRFSGRVHGMASTKMWHIDSCSRYNVRHLRKCANHACDTPADLQVWHNPL